LGLEKVVIRLAAATPEYTGEAPAYWGEAGGDNGRAGEAEEISR